MADLKVEQYCVGEVGTNCYLAINQETREILVVDPGDEAKLIETKIQDAGGTPVAVLLTHGHFDHAMAAKEVASHYGIEVYACEAEQDTLKEPGYNLSGMIGRKDSYGAHVYLKDGQLLELAGFQIQVLHTPGHTPGGCCYYFKEKDVLFSGDTLFHQSIGRTDFPRGSMSRLVRSIKEKLMCLPDHTKVYPGHMSMTTIGEERDYNPYL